MLFVVCSPLWTDAYSTAPVRLTARAAGDPATGVPSELYMLLGSCVSDYMAMSKCYKRFYMLALLGFCTSLVAGPVTVHGPVAVCGSHFVQQGLDVQ